MQAIEVFDAYVRKLPVTDSGDVTLPRCRDRDDQKFLELAHQAGAAALLTRDEELLRLARRTKRDGLFSILPPASWQATILP
jgi:predicted nucleic acid-binding protein